MLSREKWKEYVSGYLLGKKKKGVSKCVCIRCQMCFEGRENRRKGERRKVDAGKSLEEIERLLNGYL